MCTILPLYLCFLALTAATRAMKRVPTTPRTAYWNCSRSQDAAQRYSNTFGLVALSCHFALDVLFLSKEYWPKVNRTVNSEFLPPVDRGFGYGANFLISDDQDPLEDVFEIVCFALAPPRPQPGRPTPRSLWRCPSIQTDPRQSSSLTCRELKHNSAAFFGFDTTVRCSEKVPNLEIRERAKSTTATRHKANGSVASTWTFTFAAALPGLRNNGLPGPNGLWNTAFTLVIQHKRTWLTTCTSSSPVPSKTAPACERPQLPTKPGAPLILLRLPQRPHGTGKKLCHCLQQYQPMEATGTRHPLPTRSDSRWMPCAVFFSCCGRDTHHHSGPRHVASKYANSRVETNRHPTQGCQPKNLRATTPKTGGRPTSELACTNPTTGRPPYSLTSRSPTIHPSGAPSSFLLAAPAPACSSAMCTSVPSGLLAALQAADVECVVLVPAWVIWAAQDTCVDAVQLACTLLACVSEGTLSGCEEGEEEEFSGTHGQRWWTRGRGGREGTRTAMARMRSLHRWPEKKKDMHGASARSPF